jgi:hypothetical protein
VVIGDHDVSRDTLSDYDACVVFYDEDDFEALFFFVVATVACDSGREGTCCLCEIHDFGTIEDDYFLVFIGREGRTWRGWSFVRFPFIIFFAKGAFTLALAWPKRWGRGRGGEGYLSKNASFADEDCFCGLSCTYDTCF